MNSKISIVDLEVFCRVGVPDEERAKPQRLLLTVEMDCDFSKAAKSDSGKSADKKVTNPDGSQDDSKPSEINTDGSRDDGKSADKTATKPDNSKGDKEKRR